MTEPEVTVTLTDYEFSRGEIQSFLDEIGSQDGIASNALISISHDCKIPGQGCGEYTLSASSANRLKDES